MNIHEFGVNITSEEDLVAVAIMLPEINASFD